MIDYVIYINGKVWRHCSYRNSKHFFKRNCLDYVKPFISNNDDYLVRHIIDKENGRFIHSIHIYKNSIELSAVIVYHTGSNIIN